MTCWAAYWSGFGSGVLAGLVAAPVVLCVLAGAAVFLFLDPEDGDGDV